MKKLQVIATTITVQEGVAKMIMIGTVRCGTIESSIVKAIKGGTVERDKVAVKIFERGSSSNFYI